MRGARCGSAWCRTFLSASCTRSGVPFVVSLKLSRHGGCRWSVSFHTICWRCTTIKLWVPMRSRSQWGEGYEGRGGVGGDGDSSRWKRCGAAVGLFLPGRSATGFDTVHLVTSLPDGPLLLHRYRKFLRLPPGLRLQRRTPEELLCRQRDGWCRFCCWRSRWHLACRTHIGMQDLVRLHWFAYRPDYLYMSDDYCYYLR